MAAQSGCSAPVVPSLPPPTPKSPPQYPDLYGKRRETARVQMLEREIGFLEEELKSIERLQPASRCCKEIADFVTANPDPLIPTNRKKRRSCRFWKWLCGMPCFSLSSICCCFCCDGCPLHLEMPRCSCCGSCSGSCSNSCCSSSCCGSCSGLCCGPCSCKSCFSCPSLPKWRCCCSCPKSDCCKSNSCLCNKNCYSLPSCSCSCSCPDCSCLNCFKWKCSCPKCPKLRPCCCCKITCCNPCSICL
ncbi:guanine nucleotide-binding protein subunit gamma 3 [Argentina anserina]|uniref:guanine nucleotide-binding protein subunit gamma 3 n=1 Tax=Argentina anserina TaxID=57926 RepID=UPI0021763B46|nr:guanine nucleotide-binding protein subunit gamma 3 [Potentilla anserina]